MSTAAFEKTQRKMVTARIEFMSQLARFSKSELTRQPADDAWSPLRIAHHLYLADSLAFEQLRRIQEEDNPLIDNVARTAPQATQNSATPAALETLLTDMAEQREKIFEYLAQLPEEAWEKPFRHETWGDRKFYQLVNVLYMHDQQHAQQLDALKAEFEA